MKVALMEFTTAIDMAACESVVCIKQTLSNRCNQQILMSKLLLLIKMSFLFSFNIVCESDESCPNEFACVDGKCGK